MSTRRILNNTLGACAIATMLVASFPDASRAAEPATTTSTKTRAPTVSAQTFDSAQKAADALIAAAGKYDEAALKRLVGSAGIDLVSTGEKAQDRERAAEFAAQARRKMQVTIDPKRFGLPRGGAWITETHLTVRITTITGAAQVDR